MKRVFQALVLTAAAVAAFLPAPSQAWPVGGSTCWVTCVSLTTGIQHYKYFNTSQGDCCSGVYSCPPGANASYAWGEPAALCPFGGGPD